MEIELAQRRCVPCSAETRPLASAEVETLLGGVPSWRLQDGKLVRRMTFKDFVGAMGFVDRVADLAEHEGHHPDFCVHYRVVDFTLYTHAIGGLSENDFVLAAKIDHLADSG